MLMHKVLYMAWQGRLMLCSEYHLSPNCFSYFVAKKRIKNQIISN